MFDNYGQSQPQTPTAPPPSPGAVRFDKRYVTTKPGILKVVQLAASLLGFISIKISWGAWISAIFYNILYWVCIIITGIILLSYTFHLVEKFVNIPWQKLEFFYCGIVCVTYFILSIIATTIGESVGFVVGFFGLCAIVAYGYDGYLNYKGWKRGLPPQ
ncbi:hypothetical protein NE865_12569 [Phthorimaea operculella]|nr:hypothetical protein NE865_12569 [Phthorimaea operculella]